jgi:glutathione S-transferase
MTMAEGRAMSDTRYTLIIGDKNFSSWSLRPWLAMARAGLPFAEERIWLRQPETKAAILRHSPSGKVPALKTNGLTVCDSIAILEYLAERHPELVLWPQEPEARAVARSVSAEMHSGFMALRNDMSMDLLTRLPTPPVTEALEGDIRRIVSIWREARAKHGGSGPFLFGGFSNVDAMFAPVATRFRTYGIDLATFGDDGSAAAYAQTILALPEMATWSEGAEAEMKQRGARVLTRLTRVSASI